MPYIAAKGIVDRRFHLIILDVASQLAATSESAKHLVRRVERLLDREVRIVVVGAEDGPRPPHDVCPEIGGLSRVFLSVWTPRGEIFGFNQWGPAVSLTKGPADTPDAAAARILDLIAGPAEIRPGQILVIGEHFGPGGRDRVFATKAFTGARLVTVTEAEDLPLEVRKVPIVPESTVALLDTLLWIWG